MNSDAFSFSLDLVTAFESRLLRLDPDVNLFWVVLVLVLSGDLLFGASLRLESQFVFETSTEVDREKSLLGFRFFPMTDVSSTSSGASCELRVGFFCRFLGGRELAISPMRSTKLWNSPFNSSCTFH